MTEKTLHRGILDKIRRTMRHPEALRRRFRISLVRPFVKSSVDQISFLDRDWDVLVILDACRYDLFKELNPFEVSPKKVHSNASHTAEFLEKNFGDGSFEDIVYVTASPQVARCDAKFAHVEHVWRDQWNGEHRTVLPEDVTEAALEAGREFPNKRIIVHYMQPHYPFIGPTSESLLSHASYREEEEARIWEHLSASRVDPDIVKQAYRENLEIALPAVERFAEQIDGKVVITSDHGNLFGKRVCPLPIKIYGHPPNIPDPDLTAVPWVELPHETRRDVVVGGAKSSTGVEGDIKEKLADLGYV